MANTADMLQLDVHLVRRAQQGDDAAFDRLVELCTPRVYNLAYRLVGNADDAQDLAQQAFVRVYHALPRFKGESAFTTWLYRVVVNVCQDELKRRKRRPSAFTDLEGADDDRDPLSDRVADTHSPEDDLLRNERQQLVQQAIARLPEIFRLVLVLYDLQGFSYQETADMLQTNVGTVKSRLNRARNQLREELSPHRELFGFSGSLTDK